MAFDLQLVGGDLVIQNGDLAQVTSSNKLLQDILKIAITQVGTNPYQPWYGSLISNTLIGSVLSDDIIVNAAQGQLQTAISALQTMQVRQVQGKVPLTAAEQIAAIKNINVYRDPNDLRQFNVEISVITKAYTPITAVFSVTPF
jgi:hypothetical protein